MNDSTLDKKDRPGLRDLAAQVAEIAAVPVQQETIRLWKSLNGLHPVRPMVLIGQIPWHEMNVEDELTLRCCGEFARELGNPAAGCASKSQCVNGEAAVWRCARQEKEASP